MTETKTTAQIAGRRSSIDTRLSSRPCPRLDDRLRLEPKPGDI